MQEAKKKTVENCQSEPAPSVSAQRSVLGWQSLLLVVLLLLHWQYLYQFRVSVHYFENAWQEKRGSVFKRSDKRKIPRAIEVSNRKGHGSVHSSGQNINCNYMHAIKTNLYVVHNTQDGERCETRYGRWGKSSDSEPRWVSRRDLCHFEGYWLGGLCTWELITLDFAKNKQQYAHREEILRDQKAPSEVANSRQKNIKEKKVSEKMQQAKRKKQQNKIAKQLLQRTVEAAEVEKIQRAPTHKPDIRGDINSAENAVHTESDANKSPKATENEGTGKNCGIEANKSGNPNDSNEEQPQSDSKMQKRRSEEECSSDFETAGSESERDNLTDIDVGPPSVIEHDMPDDFTNSDNIITTDEETKISAAEEQKLRELEETIAQIRRERASRHDTPSHRARARKQNWRGWRRAAPKPNPYHPTDSDGDGAFTGRYRHGGEYQ